MKFFSVYLSIDHLNHYRIGSNIPELQEKKSQAENTDLKICHIFKKKLLEWTLCL